MPPNKVNKRGKFYSFAGTFDSVGSTELQDAGKAGLVMVQGKISAVVGTVLVCKFIKHLPLKCL